MFLRAVVRSSAPATKLVISFQKEPAPTAPGMLSEPSKRRVLALTMAAPMTRSMSEPYQLRSASFCGAIAPPCLHPGLEMLTLGEVFHDGHDFGAVVGGAPDVAGDFGGRVVLRVDGREVERAVIDAGLQALAGRSW